MKQDPLIGQFSFFKQLHNFAFDGGVVSSVFLLCPSILAFRFGMQEYHNFKVYFLKIL